MDSHDELAMDKYGSLNVWTCLRLHTKRLRTYPDEINLTLSYNSTLNELQSCGRSLMKQINCDYLKR